MAATKIALSLLAPHPSSFSSSPKTPLPLSHLSLCNKLNSTSVPSLFQNLPPINFNPTIKTSRVIFVQRCSSTVQELIPATGSEKTQEETPHKKKLYVVNLPWSLSVADIKNLFGECGTVTDVEIIKQSNGRSRGFAFVTMESAEEAQACVEKFDSHEVSGRIIRVEYAKRLKRPSPPPPPGTPDTETRHKLYVSNLAWKVRSTHLREFFSTNFSPVSSRVVFDGPSGRSSGYGFVSFATREEAEAAISALDGKELMGRPLRLKFSDQKTKETGNEKQEENVEGQPEE
ncbi:28 kDa ribonucleoprotein, chloroplastic isoform X1 [Mercurialis annua]|uniref:28 kDa ribonucleoprotein, chloroplastic isoform X1 n=1 Tax=Mercurialis annua TaxID=3986 RepID=UPI00215DDCAB|nr:28 kDa ribonucleoprotein, chloroplastic isoform X1 [Mercurialis annua]